MSLSELWTMSFAKHKMSCRWTFLQAGIPKYTSISTKIVKKGIDKADEAEN
uniref:Uncharacterized protein n=1 Tax=Heterorhabditis bacteriophora TaxID=37862 RepID=A0A1I7WRP8_HETBA